MNTSLFKKPQNELSEEEKRELQELIRRMKAFSNAKVPLVNVGNNGGKL